MNDPLNCYLSSKNPNETSHLKQILISKQIIVSDLFDLLTEQPIHQSLKKRLRQSDFAIFVLTNDFSQTIFEIGICEGIGKPYFIIVDNDFDVPVYLRSAYCLKADLKNLYFLARSVETILNIVQNAKGKSLSKTSHSKNRIENVLDFEKKKSLSYDVKTIIALQEHLESLRIKRGNINGRELEDLVEDVFKTIRLTYVDNKSGRDEGVDFAIWSDELGKIFGNPIIVEVKLGNFSSMQMRKFEEQLRHYADKSDAKIAIFIYLDRNNKRHKLQSSLSPLIFSYDLEDFIEDLIKVSFEKLVLDQRNKIAHGLD